MSTTAHPPDWALWKGLLKWSPFKIDALGLVTLLGAEEVNASVGRLVRSHYLEYFPLLGAFVISGNAFRNKQAGFNLYNITQGIHTTDLAAWLTRWMQSQKFESNRSLVRWTVEPIKVPGWEKALGWSLPCIANGMLLAMTVLSYDWYGFANAIAMFLSIVVRYYMVSSIRNAIDARVREAYDSFYPHQHLTAEEAISKWKVRNKQETAALNGGDYEAKEPAMPPHNMSDGVGWNGTEPAKVLIIMNDAKAVTMMIPRDLLTPPSVFIANLDPPNRALYGIARWLGWIAFAVQVITIGMADLATQIVTVALLVIPTVLFVARLGCDDSSWWKNTRKFLCPMLPKALRSRVPQPHDYGRYWPELQSVSWIGSMLKAEVYEWPLSHEFPHDADGKVDIALLKGDTQYIAKQRPNSKRQWLYAWLQMSEEEQVSMDKWDLFPHKRGNNSSWLSQFAQMTERTRRIQRNHWGIRTLVGTPNPKVSAATTLSAAALQQGVQEPKLPKLDTKVPKHHFGTKPSKDQEDQDTANTAQDGAALDPNSPSLYSSPGGITSPAIGHRTSVAFLPSAEDRRDGIKPPKRASTEPPGHSRRHSITATRPVNSAFWLTSQINQQEEEEEVTSESDDTVSGRRQDAGGGSDSIGDMH